MVELGKVANPQTNKAEVNIQQAAQAIDMLEILKEKTKGNLSNDMQKTQDIMLSELRLNFVDESNKQKHEST